MNESKLYSRRIAVVDSIVLLSSTLKPLIQRMSSNCNVTSTVNSDPVDTPLILPMTELPLESRKVTVAAESKVLLETPGNASSR